MSIKILNRKIDPAVSITVKFLIAGILWIIFSDALLAGFDPSWFLIDYAHAQTLKGILFVGINAAVIFVIVQNYVHTINGLKREQEYFFHYNPTPMVLIDSFSFRFKGANEAASKLLGYTSAELHAFSLYHLVSGDDQRKFESAMLFIRTGFDRLGSWKFKCKDGSTLHATISSKAIREKEVFLISFQDIRDQIVLENELDALNKKMLFEVGKHTEQLETRNEELAYRASQAQHINEELILVNEQLLNVNKKIAAERDEALLKTHCFDHLPYAQWCFNLGDEEKNFIDAKVAALFETTVGRNVDPWFWSDFVDPIQRHLVDESKNRLGKFNEFVGEFRVITGNGNVKMVFVLLKKITDVHDQVFIVGAAMDVTTAQLIGSAVSINRNFKVQS